MVRLNRNQQVALLRKWRQSDNDMTFMQFRRSVTTALDCVMVHWCGQWLGIKTDGHTHFLFRHTSIGEK